MDKTMGITELARATGISQQRLLAWEDAAYIKPYLTKKGVRFVRLYAPAVIERVRQIKAMVDAGYRVSKAAEIIDAEKPCTRRIE